MYYTIDDERIHACNPEQYVIAAKQMYGVELIWEQPKDKIVTDWVDSSHMVYTSEGDELYWKEEETEVVIFYTDIYKTTDGSPLPEELVKDLKEEYGKSEYSVEGSTISIRVDCR